MYLHRPTDNSHSFVDNLFSSIDLRFYMTMFESTIYLNVRFNFERVGKNNRTLPNELFQKC